MNNEIKKIGIIIHTNQHLVDLAVLCDELFKRRKFEILLFVNANRKEKPWLNPSCHPKHLAAVEYDQLVWYKSAAELAELLRAQGVAAVFTVEDQPFIKQPELFKTRPYKIYSAVHNVNKIWHEQGIAAGVLDKSIIGYKKYAEFFGWNENDYAVTGLPRFDPMVNFNAADIRAKYQLPGKYILLFSPNNDQLNWFVVYRLAKEMRRRGYAVVIKGKYPKCHKFIYRFLADKYFLSDTSFFPFVSHELIFASSGVIGFDTTAVEEVLMCGRPLVNFHVKTYREKESIDGMFKPLVPLWAADFCLDLDFMVFTRWRHAFKPLPEFVSHFSQNFDYQQLRARLLTEPGGASARVVDWLEGELGMKK